MVEGKGELGRKNHVEISFQEQESRKTSRQERVKFATDISDRLVELISDVDRIAPEIEFYPPAQERINFFHRNRDKIIDASMVGKTKDVNEQIGMLEELRDGLKIDSEPQNIQRAASEMLDEVRRNYELLVSRLNNTLGENITIWIRSKKADEIDELTFLRSQLNQAQEKGLLNIKERRDLRKLYDRLKTLTALEGAEFEKYLGIARPGESSDEVKY